MLCKARQKSTRRASGYRILACNKFIILCKFPLISRIKSQQWRKVTNKRNTIPIKKRGSLVFAKSYGAVTFGVDERIIEVEVSYGFPAIDIVGFLIWRWRSRVSVCARRSRIRAWSSSLRGWRSILRLRTYERIAHGKNTNFQGFYGIDSMGVYIQELG